MNHNQPSNEEMSFDRLVDGELGSDQRRRLLESLDTQPNGWRRCALAFLEAQTWRQELGQLARAPRSESTAAPPSKSQWRIGAQWLALAAGLLVAFGLGWLGRTHNEQIAGSTLNGNGQVAQSALPTGKPDDALTLFVKDKSGRMQPVYVPLVDANTLDRELDVAFQPAMTDAVRQQLRNQGYDVQSKHQYAPLWTESGRPMIVPVEDTKIVPVSNRGI